MNDGRCLSWVHIGDLHMDEANGWQSRDWLAAIVAKLFGSTAQLVMRSIPVAPGRDIHSICAWPEHGIAGTQLGPNKNGKHW